MVVLLPFAAISYPPQGEGETTEEYNLFKLRYEGDSSVVFSTAFKEDWENWTRMICVSVIYDLQSSDTYTLFLFIRN